MKPKAIKKLRAELGFTQEKMAEELGVTRGLIAQWEGGILVMRPVYKKLLRRIAAEREVKV